MGVLKVYLARKLVRIIDGRRIMENDACFLHKKHAENYIDMKPGIDGHKCEWSKKKHGDWDIQTLYVIEEDGSPLSIAYKDKLQKDNLKSEYPDKLYVAEKISSNGYTCLDYRNYSDDVEYIRSDLLEIKGGRS